MADLERALIDAGVRDLTDGVRITIEVQRGDGHSRLTLPVVPNRGSAQPTALAPSPTPVGLVSAAVQPPVWQHSVTF